MTVDVAQQKYSNNKYYTLVFRYTSRGPAHYA